MWKPTDLAQVMYETFVSKYMRLPSAPSGAYRIARRWQKNGCLAASAHVDGLVWPLSARTGKISVLVEDVLYRSPFYRTN